MNPLRRLFRAHVFSTTIYSAGGWVPMMNGLHEADPNLLLPMGSFGLTVAGVVSVLGFLGIGIAFAGVP